MACSINRPKTVKRLWDFADIACFYKGCQSKKGSGDMLSVLVNWIYMTVFVYLCGDFFVCVYQKVIHRTENLGFFHKMFAGILFATCYAQIYSLFDRVALAANIILVVFCAIYAFAGRKFSKVRFHILKNHWKSSDRKKKAAVLLLFAATLLYAFSSAGPAKLIDTDWYHAQTIRWIEEYGCVKGVANLFYALGFNNAQHYFDALFSMKPFWGQSMRASGGFFGLLIFAHGLFRVLNVRERKSHIADCLAVWEMVYSIIITAFYADPYTDTLPNALILFIFTEWIARLEEKKETPQEMAFYCILGVFAVVSKTSAVMALLLVVHPVYLLIRQKRAGEIWKYFLTGFLVTVPYLITNILTTGYPVYLFAAFDIMDVPWKIDAGVLRYSVDNMVQFARIPDGTMEEALHGGLSWIPKWFLRESVSHQILYLLIVIIFLYDIIQIIKGLLSKNTQITWMVLPRISAYCGIFYWLFTIPQVKYCWAYLIFPVAAVPVYYAQNKKKKSPFLIGIMASSVCVLLLYAGFYLLRTGKYAWEGFVKYPLMQADYETHVFDTVEKNGHIFYTRIDGGDIVCGYYIFPYLDNKDNLNELMVGENLGDGFYMQDY